MAQNAPSGGARREIRTRAVELSVAALTFAFGALVSYESYRLGSSWGSDGPQAGYFPFYIGLIICGASLANFGRVLFSKIPGVSDRIFVERTAGKEGAQRFTAPTHFESPTMYEKFIKRLVQDAQRDIETLGRLVDGEEVRMGQVLRDANVGERLRRHGMGDGGARGGDAGPLLRAPELGQRRIGQAVAGRAGQVAVVLVADAGGSDQDRKSTRLNSSHMSESRMPSSA